MNVQDSLLIANIWRGFVIIQKN